MVWAGFVASGKVPKVSIRGRMNSESNVDVLAENLLPEAPFITDGDYLFQ